MKPVDVIGWVSSLILVLTLGKQVRKQWQTRDSGGVSTWLFIGQLAASVPHYEAAVRLQKDNKDAVEELAAVRAALGLK